MTNSYYLGTVPMLPDLEKIDAFVDDDDVSRFKVPTIYFEGMSDTYEEDPVYDWLKDSVILIKNQYAVKYIESTFNEVLLRDNNGDCEWVNGKLGEIECIDIEGREDTRVAKEYFVEMYDLEKGEKKRGKVVFEVTSPMSECDFRELKKFNPVDGTSDWSNCVDTAEMKMREKLSKEQHSVVPIIFHY